MYPPYEKRLKQVCEEHYKGKGYSKARRVVACRMTKTADVMELGMKLMLV